MKDLVVLVADKDIEHALKGLLTRTKALHFRPVSVEILVHHQHDPACAQRGVEFLSMFSEMYRYGLLMFDHEGSGREQTPHQELQEMLTAEFRRTDWGDRARTIVIAPELEIWVWSNSPHVDAVMGWKGKSPPLRQWLLEQGLLQKGESKPSRPKEAFQTALRRSQTPRSSSLFQEIAEKVSLRGCVEPSFREFIRTLRNWFPEEK